MKRKLKITIKDDHNHYALIEQVNNRENEINRGIFLDKDQYEQLRQHFVSGSLPTEEQVLQTIFDCVFIRGMELEDYKRNFTNEQSGLYDALVKLFKDNDR